MKRFFYAAGETKEAKIAESASHPECTFTYIPPTVAQGADIEQRCEDVRADTRKLAKVMIDVVAEHVRTWNVVDEKGEPVPPANKEALNRVDPALLGRIFLVVRNRTAGDMDEANAEGGLGNS